MYLWILPLLIFGQIGDIKSQNSQGSCRTSRNEEGVCINIKQCAYVIDLLRNNRGDPVIIEYVKSSSCGYEDATPKICCRNQEDSLFRIFPSAPQCGTTEVLEHDKIVGGSPAELGAWPWLAALGYRAPGSSRTQWLCGGALVNERYIITAAHCTKHPRLELKVVRLGELNLDNKVKDNANPIDFNIEKIIPHESYSSAKFTDDIALLKLAKNVPFNTLIQPICLPHTSDLRSSDFVTKSPYIAGWGSTSFKGPSSQALLEAQIGVVENSRCAAVYKEKSLTIINRQLCAGNNTGGIDACQGDSGGPLMVPVKINFYLIGVVSFGYKCAEPGFPGVYTRVTSYLDWLSKNMK